jgi:hypothetical protein
MSVRPTRNRACVRSNPTAPRQQFTSKSRTGPTNGQITQYFRPFALSTSLQTLYFALSTFRGGRHA